MTWPLLTGTHLAPTARKMVQVAARVAPSPVSTVEFMTTPSMRILLLARRAENLTISIWGMRSKLGLAVMSTFRLSGSNATGGFKMMGGSAARAPLKVRATMPMATKYALVMTVSPGGYVALVPLLSAGRSRSLVAANKKLHKQNDRRNGSSSARRSWWDQAGG